MNNKNDTGLFWVLRINLRESDKLEELLQTLHLTGNEGAFEVEVPGFVRPRRQAIVMVKTKQPATWDQLREEYSDVQGSIYPVRCAWDRSRDESVFRFYCSEYSSGAAAKPSQPSAEPEVADPVTRSGTHYKRQR